MSQKPPSHNSTENGSYSTLDMKPDSRYSFQSMNEAPVPADYNPPTASSHPDSAKYASYFGNREKSSASYNHSLSSSQTDFVPASSSPLALMQPPSKNHIYPSYDQPHYGHKQTYPQTSHNAPGPYSSGSFPESDPSPPTRSFHRSQPSARYSLPGYTQGSYSNSQSSSPYHNYGPNYNSSSVYQGGFTHSSSAPFNQPNYHPSHYNYMNQSNHLSNNHSRNHSDSYSPYPFQDLEKLDSNNSGSPPLSRPHSFHSSASTNSDSIIDSIPNAVSVVEQTVYEDENISHGSQGSELSPIVSQPDAVSIKVSKSNLLFSNLPSSTTSVSLQTLFSKLNIPLPNLPLVQKDTGTASIAFESPHLAHKVAEMLQPHSIDGRSFFITPSISNRIRKRSLSNPTRPDADIAVSSPLINRHISSEDMHHINNRNRYAQNRSTALGTHVQPPIQHMHQHSHHYQSKQSPGIGGPPQQHQASVSTIVNQHPGNNPPIHQMEYLSLDMQPPQYPPYEYPPQHHAMSAQNSVYVQHHSSSQRHSPQQRQHSNHRHEYYSGLHQNHQHGNHQNSYSPIHQQHSSSVSSRSPSLGGHNQSIHAENHIPHQSHHIMHKSGGLGYPSNTSSKFPKHQFITPPANYSSFSESSETAPPKDPGRWIHPDSYKLRQNRDPFVNTEADRRIFIGNLNYQTSVDDIRIHLEKCIGPVLMVELVLSPKGVSRGSALALFAKPGSASIAIEKLNETRFGGRQIFVRQDIEAGRKVYIRNLPPNTLWSQLKQFFSLAGSVLRAHVSSSRAEGSVLFRTPETANNAIKAFHQKSFDGYPLYVSLDEF